MVSMADGAAGVFRRALGIGNLDRVERRRAAAGRALDMADLPRLRTIEAALHDAGVLLSSGSRVFGGRTIWAPSLCWNRGIFALLRGPPVARRSSIDPAGDQTTTADGVLVGAPDMGGAGAPVACRVRLGARIC